MSRRESPSPAAAKGDAAAAAAASASPSDAAGYGPHTSVKVAVAEGAHTEAAFDALTRALAVEPGHPLAAHLMAGGHPRIKLARSSFVLFRSRSPEAYNQRCYYHHVLALVLWRRMILLLFKKKKKTAE